MLKVFIGYDDREGDAWDVCAHSLRKHSSIPLAITALKQDRLRSRGLYTRPEDEKASTQFAHTRFLVPALCDYEGFALFVDCDFLFTQDIAKLWPHCDRNAVVNVVKHDYIPKSQWKMDGQPQAAYPRKNWSSLMVFNNGLAGRVLTPEYVNGVLPHRLHQFHWAGGDFEGDDVNIHALPTEWNWLEGEYEWPLGSTHPQLRKHDGCAVLQDGTITPPPAAIHFTNGGPWFADHRSCRFGELWVHAHYEVVHERENRK